MTQTAALLQEALIYFRSRPGLARLLEALVAKYRKLGRLGGVIVLEAVTAEERIALEAFFRRRFGGNDRLRVSATQFAQALDETRFGSLEPLDILTAWHDGELLTCQAERDRLETMRLTTIRQLLAEFPAPFCQAWLQAALAQDPATRQIQRILAKRADIDRIVIPVLNALTNLPQEYKRLPVFSRKVCGDPHGLDFDRDAGKLFLDGLRYLRVYAAGSSRSDSAGVEPLSAVEERNELLYHFKLLRDDLLNFATCYGFAAYRERGEIPYWRMAAIAGAPLNVPLREIIQVAALRPIGEAEPAQLEPLDYDVFIVENSGVFTALLDACAACQPQLVCLHGQFKLASWALLDRLAQSGAVFHYAGDFDPEGLQMAAKLLRRYPGRAALWRMAVTDYLRALPSVAINQVRLKKLASLQTPELDPLAELIAAKGLVAYQEGILDLLAEDIQQWGKKGAH